jgi:hypothetical protein
MAEPVDHLLTLRAEVMAKHYQKLRDQVGRSWEHRNRRYVFLLCMLAVAALLSFVQGPIVQALGRGSSTELSDLVKRLPSVNNLEVAWSIVATLLAYNASVVFDLFMIVFLVAAFYLTADLFHRSRLLVDSYAYLALVEGDIRRALQFGNQDVAFSKEGAFYRVTVSRMSPLVGIANKWMLLCLLGFFFAVRIRGDYPVDGIPWNSPALADMATWMTWARTHFLFVLDMLTTALTVPLLAGYLFLRPRSEAKLREAVAKEMAKTQS